MIYYSPSNKGFYKDGIHSNIPEDAVKITKALYKKLLKEESEGKQISFKNGKVTTIAPPSLSESEQALIDIRRLESEITPRRIREAILNEAGKSWLQAKEAEINEYRSKINSEE